MSHFADEPAAEEGGAGNAAEAGAGEADIARPARPRRRRGRRPPVDRSDEAGAAVDQAAEDAGSVVPVEPDLEAAQDVESVGVAPAPAAPQPALARPPEESGYAPPAPRPRPVGGYGTAQHPPRGQQGGGRPGQRSPRAPSLPPGVPSAAALEEGEPGRAVAPTRPEPQGDLAVLLRGFEDIQQRNTDRILSALRQTGGGENGAPRAASAERLGVFVDVPNLVYAARYLNRWIDFGRLLERLLAGRRLIRAHAYSPTDPDPSADQQFLTPVKSQGYRLTTKNYRTFASGAKKADMDLDLCMDVVRLVVAKAVDCVVLCSGDGDFLPLLDFCSDNGVRVEVAAFVEATSDELRQACDRFYNLSAMEGIRLVRPLGANP